MFSQSTAIALGLYSVTLGLAFVGITLSRMIPRLDSWSDDIKDHRDATEGPDEPPTPNGDGLSSGSRPTTPDTTQEP
jgi:hypothetical protein